MEDLQELLSNAAKLAELELQLPLLKDRQAELKEIAADRKNDRDWARLTAKNWEEPTFFQQLLGKVAEKQEKAQAEARQAAAAYEEVRQELDVLEHQLNSCQEAYDALSGSRESYDLARTAFLATADSEGEHKLRMLEIEAFRPVAIDALRQIRNALHSARGWMVKELQPRYASRETRRMEFLQLADDYAQMLRGMLVFFPEGSVTLGASMTAPSDYIRSVSTDLSQTDFLNNAIEQSLRVQAQLEAL